MKETYLELRQRQQHEFNMLPLKFAYSDEQLKKGMKELGLDPTDTDKIVKIYDDFTFYDFTFCRKEDVDKIIDFIERCSKELEEAFQDYDFVIDAFQCELDDHSFALTGNWRAGTEAIADALGMDPKEMLKDSFYQSALREAMERIVEREEKKEKSQEISER